MELAVLVCLGGARGFTGPLNWSNRFEGRCKRIRVDIVSTIVLKK